MQNKAWKELWANPTDKWLAIASSIIAVVVVATMSQYLLLIEQRQGVIIFDPVHAVVGPIDLSWVIFGILYGSLILAVFWLWGQPKIIFQGLRAYAILLCLRMVAMWLLPLDPPTTMIAMPDPIVELFASSSGAPLTRDLFFSGHTSSMFLAAFLMPTSKCRWVFVGLGTIVGVSLILQHVHYSIDVLVAPWAALTAVVLSGRHSS